MTITEVCVAAKKLGMDYGAYVYKYKPSGSREIIQTGQKECPECGKHFTPTNGRQTFCSSSCRGRVNGRKRPAVSHDNRRKYRVEQYDMDGNFVEIYDSLNKAARAVGTYATGIRDAALKDEPHCGYKWLFADPGTVQQYDIDGRLIAEYDTIQRAEEATGIDKKYIRECLNGRQKRAAGFIWRYSSDDQELSFGIMQYTPEGEFVKRWETMRDAENALDLPRGSISRVIHGERQTTGGFVWKKAVPTETA